MSSHVISVSAAIVVSVSLGVPGCAVKFEDWALVEEGTGGSFASGGEVTGGVGVVGGEAGFAGGGESGVDDDAGGVGGASSGGTTNAGAATGASGGGPATGGAQGGTDTGGAGMGGLATGGLAIGGALTGGVPTGGVATGGDCAGAGGVLKCGGAAGDAGGDGGGAGAGGTACALVKRSQGEELSFPVCPSGVVGFCGEPGEPGQVRLFAPRPLGMGALVIEARAVGVTTAEPETWPLLKLDDTSEALGLRIMPDTVMRYRFEISGATWVLGSMYLNWGGDTDVEIRGIEVWDCDGESGEPAGTAGAPGDCVQIERIPWQDLELGSCCCCDECDQYHGFCEDGVTDAIAVPAPELAAGAVVVDAWTSVEVDEARPDTWPWLWIAGYERQAVRVAGAPVSRFWFDVGTTDTAALILRAAQINLGTTERDLNVDAVEFWECAP